MIKPLLLTLVLAVGGAPAMAGVAGFEVAEGIQMAQIDFDAYHALLLERCKVVAPDAVDALAAATAQWRERNADALIILRQLFKVQLIQQLRAHKPDVTDAEIDAHVAGVQGLFNMGLKDKVARLPEGEARASCEGGYAASLLTRPDLDFSALLRRMTLGR